MNIDSYNPLPETTRNNRDILDNLENDYDFINRQSQDGFRYRYLL